MSENDTPAPESPAPSEPAVQDEFKNYKAESNRKLANIDAQLQQLLASVKPAPTSSTPIKKVSVFEDEDAYAQRISDETERRIEAKMNAISAQQSKHQAIVQSIITDYPEANDTGSELHKRAQEIYAAYSDDDKGNSLAMRTAVTSAAAEIGLKPKSKRTSKQDDSFSMGSSTRSSGSSNRSSGLDDATIEFARRLGRPVDDPKYIAKLKETAKQGAWKGNKG